MGNILFFQEVQDLLTGDGEHGPDIFTPSGCDAPKPPETAATNQVHEQGLGVVVSGVGRGNKAGKGVEKSVSGLPGGAFQPPVHGNHISGADGQGNFVFFTEFPDKILVPVGFGTPQMVVKMGRRQGNIQFLPQKKQPIGHGHGIRPAGQGAGHAAGGYQILCLQKLPQLIQHASTPGP